MTRRLFSSALASLLFHAALYGAAWGLLAWRSSAAPLMAIDLAGSSLLHRVGQAKGGSPPQALQAWYLPSRSSQAPPVPRPLTASAAPEPKEEASAPCPPPCPDSPGDWIPAASASRRPVWAEGLLTEEDYPAESRRKGREGRVVADVWIDAQGAVRKVELVRSAGPEFDALVLERLANSRFRPAYDSEGNPVACRLRLPIEFTLR